MKYAALLFALLFALTGPELSATAPEAEEPIDLTDIAGLVQEIDEDTLLLQHAVLGDVLVNLTDETIFEGEEPVVGAYVHVMNNGAMTRSIPPQITALKVGCYAFTGTISEMGEGYFMLGEGGGARRINAEAEKLAELSAGMTVTVYSNGAMSMSLPPQLYGEWIVPAE